VEYEPSVFTSIAPLLALRCIPRSYYRTVHEAPSEENKQQMNKLSRFLVDAIIKTQALSNGKTDLGKEERSLVVE
jgi:hypothetical protein